MQEYKLPLKIYKQEYKVPLKTYKQKNKVPLKNILCLSSLMSTMNTC